MAKRKKLTEAEKLRRKAERKAADMTARDLKSLGGPGSLFADLVRVWTPEEAARHQLLGKITDGYPFLMTDAGNYGLVMIQVRHLERLAERHMGAEAVRNLRTYIERTYPDSYWAMIWRDVLAGRRRIATKMALCCVTEKPFVIEYAVYPAEEFVPVPAEEIPPALDLKRGDRTEDDPHGLFPMVMAYFQGDR